ncbi:hypothetical protein LINPERHAP1_LOCUS11725 [Linum perenne]
MWLHQMCMYLSCGRTIIQSFGCLKYKKVGGFLRFSESQLLELMICDI